MLNSLEFAVMQDEDISVLYAYYKSLLGFRSERTRGVKHILGLDLPAQLLDDRDFFLVSMLNTENSDSLDEEDRQEVMTVLRAGTFTYSSKRSERTIKRLLRLV